MKEILQGRDCTYTMVHMLITYTAGQFDKHQKYESHAWLHNSTMKEVGDMLGQIGCAFRELGRHNEALRMMERALDFRRRTLHKNHPDIATSMSNLAAMYGELRRYDEALWFSLEALKRLRGRLPHDHPDIAAKNSRIVRFAPPQSRKTRCSVASFSMLYSLNARPSSSCFPAKISPCYSRSCASTMVTPSDDDSDFVPYACRKFELALDAAVEGLTAISVNDLNLK